MKAPTLSEQEQFWDDWVYRSFKWQQNPDNKQRAAYILKEVVTYCKYSHKNIKILDVGCGSGWLSRELLKYGDVTATDLSPEAIKQLEGRFSDIKWIAGDFLSVELPETDYHIVTCLETIAHVPDQKAFAHRISQVTQSGGLLLLTTQNEYVWSHSSRLGPPGEGEIRNWPSRTRLKELFGPYFSIDKILTCAPAGDKGVLRLLNNRISRAIERRLPQFGQNLWIKLREKIGTGCSLFLKGIRL